MPHALARRLMALDATRTPPSEFRIWAMGDVDTTKGKFLFDVKAATSVMASWRDWGNRLTFDYGHDATSGARGEDGKSAGSCLLELRKDGLWAVDVRWTDKAAAELGAGEWLYFSPTFLTDPKTGRIKSLINIALTNVPATKNMAPLVAASRERSMTREQALQALRATKAGYGDALVNVVTLSADGGGDDDSEEMKAAKASKLAEAKKRLAKAKLEHESAARECEAMGLSEDDAADDAPGADDANAPPAAKDKPEPPTATSRTARRPVASAPRAVALSATGPSAARIAALAIEVTAGATEAEVMGRLRALSAIAEDPGTSEVAERLEAMESRLFKREAETLMANATREGRLTPKQKVYALKIGNVEELTAYLETLPVVAATRSNGRAAEVDTRVSSQLSADSIEPWEIEMCDRMGTSREDYARQKKANAERRVGAQAPIPLRAVPNRAG